MVCTHKSRSARLSVGVASMAVNAGRELIQALSDLYGYYFENNQTDDHRLQEAGSPVDRPHANQGGQDIQS